MKTIKVLFKTEWILAIREFSGVLFGVLLPAGLILLLGVIYQGEMVEQETYSRIQQAFGAVITIGICATGLMGIPLTITSYREKKSPQTLSSNTNLSHDLIASPSPE